MRSTTTDPIRRRLVGAVCAAALLLAGCGSDDSDAGFDEASGEAFEDEMVEEEMSASDDGGGDSAAAEGDGGQARSAAGDGARSDAADEVVTFGQALAAGRQLARTATITLEVDDVDEAARTVSAAATRAGGFVQTADVQGGDFGSGRLTLRVPAERLDATLQSLGDVGIRVISSGIATEDLTDQLVDLEARLTNLRALEAEYQELLTSVENSDPEARELLTVYERINGVRADIERLTAQRASAQERVALATIEVELIARAVAPEEVEPAPEDTLARAWQATVEAMRTVRDALIWIVVTILPVTLVVLGLPALALWLLVRGVRRLRRGGGGDGGGQARPAPPPAGGPTTAPDATRSGSDELTRVGDDG